MQIAVKLNTTCLFSGIFVKTASVLSSEIHTDQLLKSYGRRKVVNQVSIQVKQGEIVGLLGPNGAGKTTTFYMVVGLIKPDEGNVFLDGEEITKLPMYKRAQLGLGYLPQEASVFRKLSVEDNIMAVLEMHKMSRQARRDKVDSLLNEFRLQHVRKNMGDSLSGGERRRTEIARALAVNPKFILLDEPFAGVDPIAVEDIQSIVARLKYKNIGILITDHNVNETLSICDRAYLLIEGKIFKHGTAEELAEDEHVRKLYLGRNFELKRKDYLHDEAKQRDINVESLIVSIENALAQMERMEQSMVERERSFGARFNVMREEEDLGIDDFNEFTNDIQRSLIEFAEKNKNKEILERAKLLNGEDRDLKTDFHTILLYLKSLQ
jgi:lipopolysaccharide export system ATP-binding protein